MTPESPLRELTRHVAIMPAWPSPLDYTNGAYFSALQLHEKEMEEWSAKYREIDARVTLAMNDARRDKAQERLPDDLEDRSKIVRQRIIDEHELDILLPLMRREYHPINLIELWWRRFLKWARR